MLHKLRDFENLTILHEENHFCSGSFKIAVGYQGEELTSVFCFYHIKPFLSLQVIFSSKLVKCAC